MKERRLFRYLQAVKKFPADFFEGPEDVYFLQKMAKLLSSPDPDIIPQVAQALEEAAKAGGKYLGFDHK